MDKRRKLLNTLVAAGSLTTLALSVIPTAVAAEGLVGEGEAAGTKIVIKDIKRDEGGTVTLQFQMVNDNEKPAPVYQLLDGSLDDKVHLIDAASKKKYLTVKDASDHCICSKAKGEVEKDKPINLWAKFPAPPDSVQKITVVVSGFIPVKSVPITPR